MDAGLLSCPQRRAGFSTKSHNMQVLLIKKFIFAEKAQIICSESQCFRGTSRLLPPQNTRKNPRLQGHSLRAASPMQPLESLLTNVHTCAFGAGRSPRGGLSIATSLHIRQKNKPRIVHVSKRERAALTIFAQRAILLSAFQPGTLDMVPETMHSNKKLCTDLYTGRFAWEGVPLLHDSADHQTRRPAHGL